MSFDSVDPQNDDSVPPNNAHSKENFFAVFGPVFESNSRCVCVCVSGCVLACGPGWSAVGSAHASASVYRWSSRQPVPQLGTPDDNYEQVDQFYSFW